mmetsp:Transcript_47037/g.118487  ORF Transcript_47037/g.118487 Transcript_47037/m.118487 type:complete len:273 (-) Transcript_47037:101-919(-)
MAVSLKFLSRAPCKQQLLAASPKVLSAVTPKTPARSPLAACSPAFFGNYEHTPMRSLEDTSALGFGTLPVSGAFRRAVEASVAAQQDLVASARPSAESARQHFLARRTLCLGEATCAESPGGLLGSGLPTLLRQHDAAQTTDAQDSRVDTPEQDLATSARAYAERAHEHFLARRAQKSGAGIEKPPSDLGMPTLLGHQRAKAAGAMPSANLPVLLGHADAVAEVAAPALVHCTPAQVDELRSTALSLAEMAQQSFLSRQQSIAGRSATLQVP